MYTATAIVAEFTSPIASADYQTEIHKKRSLKLRHIIADHDWLIEPNEQSIIHSLYRELSLLSIISRWRSFLICLWATADIRSCVVVSGDWGRWWVARFVDVIDVFSWHSWTDWCCGRWTGFFIETDDRQRCEAALLTQRPRVGVVLVCVNCFQASSLRTRYQRRRTGRRLESTGRHAGRDVSLSQRWIRWPRPRTQLINWFYRRVSARSIRRFRTCHISADSTDTVSTGPHSQNFLGTFLILGQSLTQYLGKHQPDIISL